VKEYPKQAIRGDFPRAYEKGKIGTGNGAADAQEWRVLPESIESKLAGGMNAGREIGNLQKPGKKALIVGVLLGIAQ